MSKQQKDSFQHHMQNVPALYAAPLATAISEGNPRRPRRRQRAARERVTHRSEA